MIALRWRTILGWCVHAYTGLGLVVAAAVTMLLTQPERTPDTYRYCFLLMLIATVIDGTDGAMARAVRIKEAVPGFDGRRLDDIVDFLMYTFLPLLLIERAGLLPEGARWVLLLALCASAYGFCQTDIKTPDGAFLGFPSYWNILAYYLYALSSDGTVAAIVIAVLALMTFVPSRYPYPTQPGWVNRWLLVFSLPWAGLLLADLLRSWADGPGGWMVMVSFLYPAAYMAVAWGGSLWRVTGERGASAP